MSTTTIPVHVGCPPPVAGAKADAAGERTRAASWSTLGDATIDWAELGLEPRWIGSETSDCAAALDPSIFHATGADELQRFLAGTRSREELAVVISAIGDAGADPVRNVFGGSDASVLLPGGTTSINGRRLPAGTAIMLAPDLDPIDRDLGLRLLNRDAHSPWWSLTITGSVFHRGDGAPADHHEPSGRLEPILIGTLEDPVVAAWVPESEDQRWYIVPDATEWPTVLSWLAQKALPALVPRAPRRARSPYAETPTLWSNAETAARRAIDELEADYAKEHARLRADLDAATSVAEPMREGLLYGAGGELEQAVASVLAAAGLQTTDLDGELGDTVSADMLITYGNERRLVEVKSAGGNASEALVGHLERHLMTWPELRPGEPVGGGVLIVNHQHKLLPDERSPAVYTRPEFVATLTVTVVSTRELFDWWRVSDWPAIRNAVFAAPDSTSDGHTATTIAHNAAPSPRAWLRRRGTSK